MDLITVIINVYNGEKFIKKCLDSVVNQTYQNLEILVINDGSTDDTLKIIKNYKDKRIRLISTENQGLSLSRNLGIDNAKGKYLYFVDADDFIEEDTIEYLYSLIKKYDADFSTCKSLTIFDYNYEIKKSLEKVTILNSVDMLKKIIMAEDTAVTIWNKLIKKEVFEGVRFQNRIINDIVVTYKLALKSKKIVYSNQIKYLYLKHKDAITVSKSGERTERVIDNYNAIIERYENIKKIYPNLIENDIALLRGMIKIYIIDNIEIGVFLKKNNFKKKYKKIFNIKMMFAKVKTHEKLKLILFRISPSLYKKIVKKYREKKYLKRIK